MFSFEYPYVLLLLVLAVACVLFCKEKKRAIYFPNTELLGSLTRSRQWLLNTLRLAILSLLIIGLSSPIKTQQIILDNSKGHEISLILDASGSMAHLDKFRIVKAIMVDFISKRKTDKIALSVFADFAYTVVPLTYDKKSVIKMLSNIEIGVAGKRKTALYEALFLSSKLFNNSKSKERIAILLTDGKDNTNSVPLEMAIERAKENKIKVYTVAVGDQRDYNVDILSHIANSTGAKFFSANSQKSIEDIYKQINQLEKSEININKYEKKIYYFHYPLSLALIFLWIYFWRKNTWNLNK
ncbi:VWA domain-containing protein [uncultured Candidatus Thioglobus sp.]|jgi:Ca-activated chloride channel family protein|uniref:vWA domain-containing protein n=1 Tax=uncultured Candidatus Thioglobus sp. TaxID=655186 RepID=UPI001D4D516C|nr:VWA domain-containing protein [Candidatus Thioglobus sp.]MBT4182137.1 VWA domain-containing protein [Candidatus Thioglobus sp.]MBT4422378.1 VWA domain-containing protein [Candidatus Thioglobus sp.]MBT4747200.1 VWA domain-containing protein [Candidatus Thioglobus sp.]MBT5164701.1 VWA domain-containing protein [Candidatus Thioglobus sp.]